ncbi:hypothetical protein RhiirC2_791259 [Rhizophagus irregularis]|uniref:Uncharacterized protein n=1 Tax=Rhizophagus irregularis TaxID=588596 RepID=A0A2N1MJK1_9GLOM|nr:hypothetical protein RhiirC2_791259 [Rhizophagus irregularis]
MVTDQKHSTYSALSSENRVLVKRLDDYYYQHRKLKKKVNRLEKYVEEHLNWLTDDVGELYEAFSSETSSSETDSSEESNTDYASYKASVSPKKKDEDVVKSSYKKVKYRRNLT